MVVVVFWLNKLIQNYDDGKSKYQKAKQLISKTLLVSIFNAL